MQLFEKKKINTEVLSSMRGVAKKFLAQYSSVRFIELKSLSVGQLI